MTLTDILLALLVGPAMAGVSVIASGEQIELACNSAPAWKLNLCNLTCSSCSTDNSNQCSACDSAYSFSSKTCYLSNSTNYYTYYSLVAEPVLDLQDIQKFSMESSIVPLGNSSTVYLCSTDNYKFQMLGLFSNTEVVTLPLSFRETIQQVTIKFNVLVLANDTQLTVMFEGDGRTMTEVMTFTTGDSTGSYAPSSSEQQPNYLSVPALSSTNVRTTIHAETFTTSFNFNSMIITIGCISPSTTGDHWGISDVIILATQCNTCVTSAVRSTISFIVLLLLYTLAGTAVLIGLLFCCRAIQNRGRKTARLGSNDDKDFIPSKAINRIINNKGKGKKDLRNTDLRESQGALQEDVNKTD